tara:strand:+ start:455 stop:835 length:381 start_codon:yes stop_codon:yes gene_type:complete
MICLKCNKKFLGYDYSQCTISDSLSHHCRYDFYCNDCTIKKNICEECNLTCPECNIPLPRKINNKYFCEECFYVEVSGEIGEKLYYCTDCDKYYMTSFKSKCDHKLKNIDIWDKNEEPIDLLILFK